jgi:hypothetical protein
MSQPAHEEEFIQHLTQAGVLSAQLARTGIEAITQKTRTNIPNDAVVAARLKALGYTPETAYDTHLRTLLGEARWAKYAADPGRIITAAMITDGANAGHDMTALLTEAVNQRKWEDDPVSRAQSIAYVLRYRVERQLQRGKFLRTPTAATQSAQTASRGADAHSQASQSSGPRQRTDRTAASTGPKAANDTSGSGAQPAETPLVTPYDEELRKLLGDERWDKYAADPRRNDVARLIVRATDQGRDVKALLTHTVTQREFEKDPHSPARRVAGVLHHRLTAVLATSKFLPPGGAGPSAGGDQAGDAAQESPVPLRATDEQLTEAEVGELARRAKRLPPATARAAARAASPAPNPSSATSRGDPGRDRPPAARQPARQPGRERE